MIRLDIKAICAGPRVVLQNFSFSTDARTLLITGDTASGKTLLARALCGDFHDSEWIRFTGSAKLADHCIQLGSRDFFRKTAPSRVGFLPQTSTAFFITSSVENEILISQLCSAPSGADAKRGVADWRSSSPLAHKSTLPPLALSGGQQRLLMLENVLNTSPDHLVADGGMMSLDDQFKSRAAALIVSWLEGNPLRTFVCFGSRADKSWFEFGAVLSLTSNRNESDKQYDHLPKSKCDDTEVLRFSEVSAGPVIGKRRLLEEISLRVNAGDNIGLRGANGVGKSTLLRLVAGVRKPTKGTIYFLGKPLPSFPWNGITDGIGYLPQEPELAGPTGLGPEPSSKLVPDLRQFWRDFFGLDWNGDSETYWSMSSGQRTQAVLLSQAIFNPRLWILDEPTFRLDPSEIYRFLCATREIRPDVSTIIVSHDREFLTRATNQQFLLTAAGIELTRENNLTSADKFGIDTATRL